MEEKVLENILKYNLINKEGVLVGVSGGADSVALLCVLSKIKKQLKFPLVALHVNHNIRGEEAKRDEKFVQNLCLKLGVKCVVSSVNAIEFSHENKLTIEEGARKLRYLEFDKILKENGLSAIAVAHNQDDQAETILMHIARGAGLDGVCGMSFKNNNIIRPLLNISRAEIETYLNKNEIGFITDSTNLDNKYTRNLIRNEVIKSIEKAFPKVKSALCSFGEKVSEINDFIKTKINYTLIEEKSVGEVVLKNEAKELCETEQKLLIKECFNKINYGVDIEEKHILMAKDLQFMQVGKKLDMPQHIEVVKTYEGIEFSYNKNIVVSSTPFRVGDILELPFNRISVMPVKTYQFGRCCLYIDQDKIPTSAVWRNACEGDKFEKFSGGTKSLSKFLTDKKIDAKRRKKLVVLAVGSEVLVVPGVEISAKVQIDENTKRVIEICLNK